MERRPIATRDKNWARQLAAKLAATGITPNQISVLSSLFAIYGGACFYLAADDRLLLIGAVLGMQLRLVCNLMDGMVAVEHGKKSATGDIYNDFPDRISDIAILLGAGLFCRALPHAMDLAWANSVLAVMTAYTRNLGAAIGTPHFFTGPMAKPHRMALLSVASIAELLARGAYPILYWALVLMLLGQVLTCAFRLMKIGSHLKSKANLDSSSSHL